jgi:cell division protein FtsQ
VRILCLAALILAVVGGGYLCARAVAASGVFAISRITVRGNTRLSTGEVLALVDGLKGRSLLAGDLSEWRQRLLESAWVRDASLRRSLPSTVEITVLERLPIGVGRIRGELFLVDERGAVIDEYGPRYAELDLVVIDGLSGAAGSASAEIDGRRAALAGRLLGAVRARPDLSRRISQVDVSDPRNAVVILDQDPVLVRLGDDRFVERLEAYLDLASSLHERVPDMEYVDLRFGERVYVGTTRPGGAPALTGSRAPGPQPPAGG